MANAGPNTNGEGHLSSFVPNENGCLGLGYARPDLNFKVKLGIPPLHLTDLIEDQ
jgi:hypothetical protein